MAKFGSIFVGEVLPKDQLKLLLGCKLGCDRSGSKLKRSLWRFSQLVTEKMLTLSSEQKKDTLKGWSSIYHIDRNDMKYYETIAYSWFCTETPVNLINLLRNWLKIQWSFSQFVPRHVWLITQNNQERTYQTSVDSFANLCSFGSCSKTTGKGSSEHVSATFR